MQIYRSGTLPINKAPEKSFTGDESRVAGAVVRQDAIAVETVEGDVPGEPGSGCVLTTVAGAYEASSVDGGIGFGESAVKGDDAKLA